jgi:hypothetical protein
MLRALFTTVLLCCGAAQAQDAERETRRALLERDQQLDAFSLQLRQSQRASQAPAAQRPALDARQLSERIELDELNSRQLRGAGAPDLPAGYERPRAALERAPLVAPYEEPTLPVIAPPRPLPLTPGTERR